MRTWVEINAQALRRNLGVFRRWLPATVKIAPVIKANAYGHGTPEIIQTLQNEPIWGFCVASGDEALAARAWTDKPILCLSSWQPDLLPALIRRSIRLVAWDFFSAQQISQAAQRVRRRARVHLKIDTGTSRIGVRTERARPVISRVKRLPGLRLEGLFSHFADSENSHWPFTLEQLRRFAQIADRESTIEFNHIACTAAALRLPASWRTLIRLGIGLYGLWPSQETRLAVRHRGLRPQLSPVLSWKTRLLQVKMVPPRTPIGYGLTFWTKQPMRLGVLPIGYFDGYDRALGNRAQVFIRGRRAPVRGRICMNLTLVDLTAVPGARPGDVVNLIGGGERSSITAEELADWSDTIHYEVISRINPSIPRILV